MAAASGIHIDTVQCNVLRIVFSRLIRITLGRTRGTIQFVPATQIVFGSDFPMVPEQIVRAETSGLETSKLLDVPTRNAIDRDNALTLFSRLARTE